MTASARILEHFVKSNCSEPIRVLGASGQLGYGVPASAVRVINYPLGRAIKIVIPRRIMSGDPGDRDVYGAQQHTPLLRLEI